MFDSFEGAAKAEVSYTQTTVLLVLTNAFSTVGVYFRSCKFSGIDCPSCNIPFMFYSVCGIAYIVHIMCVSSPHLAQTTPFDAPSSEEPPPVAVQTTTVPLAASIRTPAPSSDQLPGKLVAAEEKITLLEKEKQRIKNVRVS